MQKMHHLLLLFKIASINFNEGILVVYLVKLSNEPPSFFRSVFYLKNEIICCLKNQITPSKVISADFCQNPSPMERYVIKQDSEMFIVGSRQWVYRNPPYNPVNFSGSSQVAITKHWEGVLEEEDVCLNSALGEFDSFF